MDRRLFLASGTAAWAAPRIRTVRVSSAAGSPAPRRRPSGESRRADPVPDPPASAGSGSGTLPLTGANSRRDALLGAASIVAGAAAALVGRRRA